MPKYSTYPDLFDEVKRVSIFGLKRLGYLRPYATMTGSYRWTRGGEPSGSIGVTVSLPGRFVELDYLSNGKPINYRVKLEAITTHFGNGANWYFICPATGKRCRKLYGIGDYFLSRFAYPSAMYSKQTESKRWRAFNAAMRVLDLDEQRYRKYAKAYYAGKPTKWFARWMRETERLERMPLRGLI